MKKTLCETEMKRSLRLCKVALGLLLVTSFLMLGCQPLQTPSGTQNPASPANPNKGPLTAEGTVSGGGGNGIDGVVIETFSKRIEELPEYMRFIEPVLHRMTRDEPDVLLVYLKWAAKRKSWYFVPKALPELPKDRTQLAFQSDQLALHSDQEIFIDDLSYREKSSKDRAFLLMHEMVMAARLLMKKSPEAQCAALSIESRLKCKDAEFVKIAKHNTSANHDDSKPTLLNGVDHEAVRAMTSFLMQESQNLSRLQVAAVRTNLQFVFPWDDSISYLTTKDFKSAIERFILSGRKIFEETPRPGVDATTGKRECVVQVASADTAQNVIVYGLRSIIAPATSEPESSTPTVISEVSTRTTLNPYNIEGAIHLGAFGFAGNDLIHSDKFSARGSLDETVSSEVVDIVTLDSYFSHYFGAQPPKHTMTRMEFAFSREETPRLIQIKQTEFRALPGTEGNYGPRKEHELVRNETIPPIICK